MALSMSVSAGAHNARHNTDLAYRANLRNVDADLSVGNISIRDVPIAEAYETVFGDSLRAYNAKQKSKGHPERCIGDYLSKIEKAYSDDSARVKSGNKGRVNVPKPCYEYVLQIGNRDTFGGELDNGKAEEIFRETADSIRSKTKGAIEWFQIAVHFDEKDGTPHMHMAGIPYATGCKRGLSTQVSMGGALKAAAAHGIERRLMDCDRKHLDVPEYQQAMRDYNELTDRIEQKRSRVAELDRDIEGKERTVARLDRSIETKTKRLASELDGRFY